MTPIRSAAPKTVDEYLAGVPSGMRPTLVDLRKTIRAAAPEAQEVVSYGMPALRHHGMLVYYAAFVKHCSLFVASDAVRRRFAAELKPFAAGKGTFRFTPERPIPASLVTRIVKVRVAENEAHAASRRKGKPARGQPRSGKALRP